jgi:hypothetical protein
MIDRIRPSQEQERKTRVKGIEAVKSNIQAAKAVSRVLRTSLGPKGMDKLLQGPDGDIVISECSLLGVYLRYFCPLPIHIIPFSLQQTMAPLSWSKWRSKTR